MRHATALFCLLIAVLAAKAQDDPEYRMEIGAGVGLATYEGDFNGSLTKGMKPLGAVVAKYRMNPRMAWALTLGYTQLKGSSANVETHYPLLAGQTYEFSSKLWSADVRYEYNFWPFGTGREYLGARKLTPFITLGLGLCGAKTEQSVTALQLPIGLGIKAKMATRVNMTVEWTMHFSATDGLDGKYDPYLIKSTGLFKNRDSYSAAAVTLSYDIWSKCRTCHNDRD